MFKKQSKKSESSDNKIELIRSAQTIFHGRNELGMYDIGFYNGVEYALSVLEDRKPELITVMKEPDKESDGEAKQKRTAITGIKRKRG